MLRLLCPSHQHSFVVLYSVQQLACWLVASGRPSPNGKDLFLRDCTSAAVDALTLCCTLFQPSLPSMLALRQEPPCNGLAAPDCHVQQLTWGESPWGPGHLALGRGLGRVQGRLEGGSLVDEGVEAAEVGGDE